MQIFGIDIQYILLIGTGIVIVYLIYKYWYKGGETTQSPLTSQTATQHLTSHPDATSPPPQSQQVSTNDDNKNVDDADDIKDDPNAERRTSHQWYMIDRSCDIIQADGWQDVENPTSYWHSHPVTLLEYQKRRGVSQAEEFNDIGHKAPL